MALRDDSDPPEDYDWHGDDGSDDCPQCSGTGEEYNGDVMVGFCPSCGGSGILDT